MESTNLKRLLNEDGVTCTSDGLILTTRPAWILESEDRLSYTTLIRLIECCREHHWNIDILARAEDTSIDSITKSISGNFIQPIIVGCTISIIYYVTEVRRKSYSLRFEVRDTINETLYATFDLISVFYNPVAHMAIAPPASVFNHLVSLQPTS